MRFGDGGRRDPQGLSNDDSFESQEDDCRVSNGISMRLEITAQGFQQNSRSLVMGIENFTCFTRLIS